MYIVTIRDIGIESPTRGQELWDGVVDDYRPIYYVSNRWDRLLNATFFIPRNPQKTKKED